MKYIIEIPDDVQYVLFNGKADNKYYTAVQPVAELEVLNSDYINEHFGELQDDAYKRGLEDAWEAARKIFGYEIDGGIPIDKIGRVFGYSENATFCAADIIRHNTASEAIAKLKAYEDGNHSDRIEVGDEVIDKDGDTTIVTNIHERLFDGLCRDGSTMSDLFLEDVRKTGRHYDHIGKLLEAIRA